MPVIIPELKKEESRESFVEDCVHSMKRQRNISEEEWNMMSSEKKGSMIAMCQASYNRQKKSLDISELREAVARSKEAVQNAQKSVQMDSSEKIEKVSGSYKTAYSILSNDGSRTEFSINSKSFSKAFNPQKVKGIVHKNAETGKEERFLEFTVTGEEEDRDGERMGKNAVDGMIQALKSGNIPVFGNHGLDARGNRVYRWQDMLGVWKDAFRDPLKPINAKAVMKVNMANPEGSLLWSYYEEGMPLGTSVGGQVLGQETEEVEVEQ